MKLLVKKCFSGRKRSQSPSPSRNASPNRSLSPSNNRMRDRSVSPLRYINLPISKLARVTEELESLINPAASILHEEEKELGSNKKTEEEVPASDQQKEPSTTETSETEDSIHLPQVSTSIISGEEVPASTQQKELPITKMVEPEESIILPQVATPITNAPKAENTLDIITTEVSHRLVFFQIFSKYRIEVCRDNLQPIMSSKIVLTNIFYYTSEGQSLLSNMTMIKSSLMLIY